MAGGTDRTGLDYAKLRKVHALTTSPNPHEAAVAWSKVDAMLSAAGRDRCDLPALLNAQGFDLPPDVLAAMRQDPDLAAVVRVMVEELANGLPDFRALSAALQERRKAEAAAHRPQRPTHPGLAFLHDHQHHLSPAEWASVALTNMTGLSPPARGQKEALIEYLVDRVKARMAKGSAA